jgi:GntR family histidine utilization transcriptional repressor
MTVAKAVGKLVAAGYLERNRRAGTVVRRPGLQSGVSQIADIGHEIERRGQHYSYRCLRQRADHARLRLDIQCLHLADGQPIAFEDRLINLRSVHEADHVDFAHVPPGRWLIENVAWNAAQNRVSAAAATPEIATLLSLPAGAACLVIERETYLMDEQITRVRQVFRGDAYSLVSRFTPSG